MGRKKPQPQHMGAEQRQQMEWNMLDNAAAPPSTEPTPQPDLVIVGDNDPSLRKEWEVAEKELEQAASRKEPLSHQQTLTPYLQNSNHVEVPEAVRHHFRQPEMQEQAKEIREWCLRVPLSSVEQSPERTDAWCWEVGKFVLDLEEQDCVCAEMITAHPHHCQLWLYLSQDCSGHYIYFEVSDNSVRQDTSDSNAEDERIGLKTGSKRKRQQSVENRLALFWPVALAVPDAWKFFYRVIRSGRKKFQLVCEATEGDISNGRQLQVTMYGLQESLQSLLFPSQGFIARDLNHTLLHVMEHFYNQGPLHLGKAQDHLHQDFQQLFEGVKRVQRSQEVMLQIDVQHPSLKPRLRPYQQDAVRWMLQQERFGQDEASGTGKDDLHPLYIEVTTRCGKILYYNRQGGSLVLERPQKAVSPPGGILADEMGLGKTVEVLCCMLLHPRPSVLLPDRLPTLTEMQSESEEFCEDMLVDFTPTPAQANSRDTSERTSADKVAVENPGLRRVDSDSCSLSSVPSECVTMDVTSDHTYPKMPDELGDWFGVRSEHPANDICEKVGAENAVNDSCEKMGAENAANDSCEKMGSENAANDSCEKMGAENAVNDSCEKMGAENAANDSCEKMGTENAANNTCEKVGLEFLGNDRCEKPLSSCLDSSQAQSEFKVPANPPRMPSLDCGEQSDEEEKDFDLEAILKKMEVDEEKDTASTLQPRTMEQMDEEVKVDTELEQHSGNKNSIDKEKEEAAVKADPDTRESPSQKTQDHIRETKDEDASGGETDNAESEPVTDNHSGKENGDANAAEEHTDPEAEYQPKKKKRRTSRLTKKARRKSDTPSTAGQKRRPSKSNENGASPQGGPEKRKSRIHQFVQYVSEEEYHKTCGFKLKLGPREAFFECDCGKGASDQGSRRSKKKKKHVVKCTQCRASQHAECMNYDLEDPFRGPYKCPHCHYGGEPIPSGATLIISPFSISHQWTDEIKKHIREKTISVFVYTGVGNQGYIQPQTLARQDIVITTYETLSKELNYVDLPSSQEGRRLRNPKKFMAKPTPLTAVQWWRICLDEAQMVESVTTKTAEMALRLSCVNRWCVTGTPLNHSIKDMYGLLAFLGHDPYFVEEWWTKWLYQPYIQGVQEPMFHTLASVMWRNSMKDVRDQLNLPEKSQQVYTLTFSPVENVFYRRLYDKCANEIRRVTWRLSEEEKATQLTKIDRHAVNKYLRPLRKLRQACCHPQAVRGSFMAIQESVLTMEQVLDNLIKKTCTECMESHRQMIAAMNGQAGIHLIEDRVKEAVDLYREVVRSVKEHEDRDHFKTDTLPRLHTLHNLKEVLSTCPPDVGHTLYDDTLSQQCEELKQHYLQKASGAVAVTREQLLPLKQTVAELTTQLQEGDEEWYLRILSHATVAGVGPELIQKVHVDISSKSQLTKHFRNVGGLQYVINVDFEELHKVRGHVLKAMKKLDRAKTLKDRAVLEQVIECCLRPAQNKELKTCVFCKLSDDFETFEGKLFNTSTQLKSSAAGHLGSGFWKATWHDSGLEVILKSLLSYAKTQHLSPDIVQNGNIHVRLFDAWKKEFKQLRALWVKLREEVSAVDELEMAVMRMRLRQPDEEAPGEWDFHIRERTELEATMRSLVADQKVYAARLRVKCGQLEYLKTLARGNQGKFQEGVNPEQCPICMQPLGTHWSVLHCGHCMCVSCFSHLVEKGQVGCRTHAVNISCSLCRAKMTSSEVSYVTTSAHAARQSTVKGSHSTKVEAVVQCVLDIQDGDADAKILVFATWVDVLKLIGRALEENSVTFTHLYDHGAKFVENVKQLREENQVKVLLLSYNTGSKGLNLFEKNVKQFREENQVKVLLLPYNTGSKGLNLFEASHVIMVEPTYQPSQEAQAIGRVFRMGQTKQTKIHRFIVQNTVEERIHQLMESTLRPAADSSERDKDTMTLNQLISLFDDCLETPAPFPHVDDDDNSDVASDEEQEMVVEDAEEAGPSTST